MATPLVAVEFDLYDGTQIATLRLCNYGPLIATAAGYRVQYEPRLITPIQLGTRVNGEQYGSPERGTPNSGLIEFGIARRDNMTDIWPFLDYHWKGRTFRVYLGEIGDRYEDLAIVYSGRVEDLTHDTLKASVKTTDASLDLDKPLVAELYGIVLGEAVSGTTQTNAPGANRLFLRKFTSQIDCNLAFVSIVPKAASETAKFKAAVFSDNAGIPNVLLSNGAEGIGCTAGVHLTGALLTPVKITKLTPYWIGFWTDTSIVLAEADATLDDGVTATITYSSTVGLPPYAPAMTTGQPSWEIWGSNINAGDASAPAPAAIIGLPKPILFGQGLSLAPLLEDQQNLIYRLHSGVLASVDRLSVGGIDWDKVSSNPAQGEWTTDLANGTVTLGAVTLGAEIRCDAKAEGWGTLTTAALYRQAAAIGGLSVDEIAMAVLDVIVPQLVGYYAFEVMNILDMLDRIAQGTGTLWAATPDGKITAKAISAPSATADIALASGGASNGDIASLQLSGLIPPVWRLRVEFARNWQPLTQFLEAVTESDQARLGATGIMAPPFMDYAIKTAEPRAVDLALIHSLFLTETHAIAMRDRLVDAWSVPRRLYDLTSWTDPASLDLYDTASLDYMMVSGNFRIHSAARPIGGGAAALQVWG